MGYHQLILPLFFSFYPGGILSKTGFAKMFTQKTRIVSQNVGSEGAAYLAIICMFKLRSFKFKRRFSNSKQKIKAKLF
jgi:hypothetical protein